MSKELVGHIDDEFSLKDVGSTLLDHLAKGLYEPYAVLREYIQNAVDAHREQSNRTGQPPTGAIQVEIHGQTISILDHGTGMSLDEVRNVKAIAVSPKLRSDISLTGYKGVGIWAGLSYFKSLRLYTTTADSNKGYELIIHFKEIVDGIGYTASIGDVLNPNYEIMEWEESDVAGHFTHVTLEGPIRADNMFLDSEQVKDAIRRICPCEVDPTFVFYNELTRWYSKNGFQHYRIYVNSEPVYRSYPSNVEGFETDRISINDETVAHYWRAINKENTKLRPNPDQLGGFQIVQKGFVLGESNQYSKETILGYDPIRPASYLDWYIGEIWVVNPDLRPNLPRSEFEESEITRLFIGKLRNWYLETANNTRELSPTRRVRKEYREYQETVDSFNEVFDPARVDELRNIQTALNHHESQVQDAKGKKTVGDEIKGLRNTVAERRKLLGQIGKLLSLVPRQNAHDTSDGGTHSEFSQGSTGQTPSRNAASVTGETGSGADASKKAGSKPGKSQPSDTYSPSSDTQGDDDVEVITGEVIAINVLQPLLEEVLYEELEKDVSVRILTKILSRIKEVISSK